LNFCSSEHPAQAELKHFTRKGRWCANRHQHTWSCKIWVSWSFCTLWAFSPSGQPWCVVGGRWGSIRTSTVVFPELNPSEAGRAKCNHCRHFAEWGGSPGGRVGHWGVCTQQGPPQIQHRLWLHGLPCGAWNCPSSDFSRANICWAICESLDACTGLLRSPKSSARPQRSRLFLSSFLSLLLRPA